jgi:hypothetical protein
LETQRLTEGKVPITLVPAGNELMKQLLASQPANGAPQLPG